MKVSRASRKIQSLKEKRNVEGVIKLLKRSRNVELRMEAAGALRIIGDERAVEPLIEALQDKFEGVRRNAAIALGKIGDKRAVEPLIDALQDKDEGVRRHAAVALGKIGDKRAVEPLIEALQDKFELVRGNAAGALGNIGDERAVEPLIEALQGNKSGAAAFALGIIGDERAVEPLIEALQYKFEEVRRLAAFALGEIGDKRAVEPLIKAFKSWSAGLGLEEAGKALGKIRDGRCIEALQACLNDPDEELRLVAADSLIKIGELNPGEDANGYFVSEPPEGDGLCSDNECPCPGMGADIPRGEGYLYISRSVVANRQHHRTESDAQSLISRRNDQIRGELPGFTGRVVGQQGRFAPILCCRKGAERRKLDLQVATKDAAFWWETGLVPLRPTPLAV